MFNHPQVGFTPYLFVYMKVEAGIGTSKILLDIEWSGLGCSSEEACLSGIWFTD